MLSGSAKPKMKSRMKPFLLSVGLMLGSASLSAQMTLSLTSTASRGPVGTPVVWNAQVDGIDHGDTIWYRYRARRLDQTFKTIRDFGPRTDLVWSATEHEGAYELEVTARDLVSREAATRTSLFTATPLAVDAPVITSTLHPLVFLYS